MATTVTDAPEHETAESESSMAGALFEVTKGQLSEEELAALTAVLVAASAAAATDSGTESEVNDSRVWNRRSNLRLSPRPGPGSWRRSAWQ